MIEICGETWERENVTSEPRKSELGRLLATVPMLHINVELAAEETAICEASASQLHITDNSTFFFDGTSRHLSYFDELQREEGYQAVVEMPAKQMASSHAMNRFFRAFAIFHAGAFRWVLKELFLWRLRREKMRMVILTLDTMSWITMRPCSGKGATRPIKRSRDSNPCS